MSTPHKKIIWHQGSGMFTIVFIFFYNLLNKTRYQTPLRGKLFMIRGALCLQICLRSWGSFPGTEKNLEIKCVWILFFTDIDIMNNNLQNAYLVVGDDHQD